MSFLRRFWNSEKLLSLGFNVCSGIAIVFAIVALVLSLFQQSAQSTLDRVNETIDHYSADDRLIKLLVENPRLQYDTSLPQDAYIAYLLMTTDDTPQQVLTVASSSIATVEDYERLTPYKVYTLFDSSNLNQINTVKDLTIGYECTAVASIILQIITIILASRKTSLEYSKNESNLNKVIK